MPILDIWLNSERGNINEDHDELDIDVESGGEVINYDKIGTGY